MKPMRDMFQEKCAAEKPIIIWGLAHRGEDDRRLMEAFNQLKHLLTMEAYRAGLRDGMALAQSLAEHQPEERAG